MSQGTQIEDIHTYLDRHQRKELLRFHSLAGAYEHADVLRVVLTRAARSARRTTHFDLDFPKAPQIWDAIHAQAMIRREKLRQIHEAEKTFVR